MTKKLLLTVGLILTITTKIFCQDNDGYWDKDRATTKEIQLCAGCKTWYRTDELPVGTTEVIYRITLLDENQQLSNNLVSVLSVIPDPSGISQGSAGAIALLSKISGSDKCKFTIFSSYEDANNFYTNGNYQTGCYINPNEINKFAGRLCLSNSSCLQKSPNYLWFGFKSLNMFMNEKIILEVVPWVDKKSSRGWSLEIKNNFINNCKKLEGVEKLSNTEQYCQCLLDKFQESYKVKDFQQMTSTELNKVSERFGKECLTETGELQNIYNQQRNEAISLSQQGRYSEAINKILQIINESNPTPMDYNNLGFYYLFTKQYLKAIKYLKLGEQLDESELLIKGNLAHAYLLNGDIEQAKTIYSKYKNQNVNEKMSWIDMVKSDFADFTKSGLPTENFALIISIIK